MPLVRTSGIYVLEIVEGLGSALFLFLSWSYIGVIAEILNPQIIKNPQAYVILLVLLLVVASVFMATGFTLGYDSIARASGRGTILRVSRPRRRVGGRQISTVNCSHCNSRYPATNDDISIARESRTHKVVCAYCKEPASITQENV